MVHFSGARLDARSLEAASQVVVRATRPCHAVPLQLWKSMVLSAYTWRSVMLSDATRWGSRARTGLVRLAYVASLPDGPKLWPHDVACTTAHTTRTGATRRDPPERKRAARNLCTRYAVREMQRVSHVP